MALRAQGNQISYRVVPMPAAGNYVVDMQIVSLATELAEPPISFEYFITKHLILGRRELQPLPFAMNFTHEFPWAPDEFRRL
jgi:xylose isomerase